MKAAVYYETGGPEVFRYEDVPDPTCGPGTVRAHATVLATASRDDKLERLKAFGLDHVDSVGGRTLAGSIEAAAYRGRIAYVGSAGRDATQPSFDALRPGNKTVTGIFLCAELVMNHRRVRGMIAGHLADIARGGLRVVVDRRFPLAEAAAAHAYVESREAFGRVLLIPCASRSPHDA